MADMNSDNSLGYDEKRNNLSIRIKAHKKFSNFSLEEWIEKHIPFNPGDIVFDIGCGNGNFSPTYGGEIGLSGVIVGAGSVVLRDVAPGTTVMGVHSRRKR